MHTNTHNSPPAHTLSQVVRRSSVCMAFHDWQSMDTRVPHHHHHHHHHHHALPLLWEQGRVDACYQALTTPTSTSTSTTPTSSVYSCDLLPACLPACLPKQARTRL